MAIAMKIAVVGLGFMGATHVRAIHQAQGVELAAVVDRNEERFSGDLSSIKGNLGKAGQVFDFSRIKKFTRFPDAFADPEIDAVDICLPTQLHAPIAIAALRAGKHVFVEKPMAAEADGAAQMLEEANKAGKTLMVAQVLRFFPAYVHLKDMIENGKLGTIRSALFRRRCARPEWSKWLHTTDSGGGVFDLLIHDFDMCLHLFGKPKAASATGYENLDEGVDLINANLIYDGFTALVTGGWHQTGAYPFSMEFTVIGDKGVAEFTGGKLTCYSAGGGEEQITLEAADPFVQELQYFVDCVNAGQQLVRCPPEESAEAVKLTRALQKARQSEGAKIEWAS
jgi:predicted dehydrogenase